MVVAPRNGPLPPHMKSNFRRIGIGLIGNNAPSKGICFSPAMSRSKALETLWWCGNDGDESHLAIGAFEGFRPAHCQGKAHLLAWGIIPHQSNVLLRDFWPFRWRLGAISGGGGHGDVGVGGRWRLAVGRLVLSLARILHNSRNSINAHTQRIFFWSKIFRPV
jgi:hypothetical protein